jgi:hypothetical protein
MFRASLCPSSGEQDKADKSPTVYSTGRAATDQRRWGSSVCTCWGWFHAHHQENKTKQTNRLRCTALAVLQQTRGDEVVRRALVGDGFVKPSPTSAHRFCLFLMMMGIMMLETCWVPKKNHLFCIWLVISSPSWFKIHGHMKFKKEKSTYYLQHLLQIYSNNLYFLKMELFLKEPCISLLGGL